MREILQVPHPTLSQRAQEIKAIDSQILALAKEMKRYFSFSGDLELFETQPAAAASGLAAPQLGESVRLIAAEMGENIIFIVNPVIVKASTQTFISRETCLSVAHAKAVYTVQRHKIVKVKGLTLEGGKVTYKARDTFGTILQHEIDHLDGITIDSK